MTKDAFRRMTLQQPRNGCLDWCGYIGKAGYGYCAGKRAHRVSWALEYGDIPAHLVEAVVCHACDNKACVRPDHLWLGDRGDNNIDRWLKRGFDFRRAVVYRQSGREVESSTVLGVALDFIEGRLAVGTFWRCFTVEFILTRDRARHARLDKLNLALSQQGETLKATGRVAIPPDRVHRSYRQYPRYFRVHRYGPPLSAVQERMRAERGRERAEA